MTDVTKGLIVKFMEDKDVSRVPGIILGMQEEDNVADVLPYKNCFRYLRNICAHEPAVIVNQVLSECNRNSAKLVFHPADDSEENRLVLDLRQFSAWMIKMYFLTGTFGYLCFWLALMKAVCPSLRAVRDIPTLDFSIGADEDTRSLFFRYQAYMHQYFGKVRKVHPEDVYITKLYAINRQAYLRMTFTDLMDVVELFVTGAVVPTDEGNLRGFLRLFEERDVMNEKSV